MVRPWCVVCGRPATNRHHEPPKGIGGVGRKGKEPPVLSLCGHGNVDGCHGMRHRGDLQFRWRKVFLVDDGRWEWRARVGGVWTDWHPTVDEMDWSC